MNEVFELGGSLVQDEVAQNMMRIIGEGALKLHCLLSCHVGKSLLLR